MVVKVGAVIVVVRVKGMEPISILHIRVFPLFRPVTLAAQGLFILVALGGFQGRHRGLGHLEMVGTIVHQLTRNLTVDQIKESASIPISSTTPACSRSSPPAIRGRRRRCRSRATTIADLTEDLAAEQKARVTYDNILRLSDDPDVNDVIKFLRAREIDHFQRFR